MVICIIIGRFIISFPELLLSRLYPKTGRISATSRAGERMIPSSHLPSCHTLINEVRLTESFSPFVKPY